MCACRDIAMGSYANQEVVTPPWSAADPELVGIDRCILDEIEGLWRIGVMTIESCCGHNVTPGYIAVRAEDVALMRALGYRRSSDPLVRDRPEIFLPTST